MAKSASGSKQSSELLIHDPGSIQQSHRTHVAGQPFDTLGTESAGKMIGNEEVRNETGGDVKSA